SIARDGFDIIDVQKPLHGSPFKSACERSKRQTIDVQGVELNVSPWAKCLFHECVYRRIDSVSRDTPPAKLRGKYTRVVGSNEKARSQVSELVGQSALAGAKT